MQAEEGDIVWFFNEPLEVFLVCRVDPVDGEPCFLEGSLGTFT